MLPTQAPGSRKAASGLCAKLPVKSGLAFKAKEAEPESSPSSRDEDDAADESKVAEDSTAAREGGGIKRAGSDGRKRMRPETSSSGPVKKKLLSTLSRQVSRAREGKRISCWKFREESQVSSPPSHSLEALVLALGVSCTSLQKHHATPIAPTRVITTHKNVYFQTFTTLMPAHHAQLSSNSNLASMATSKDNYQVHLPCARCQMSQLGAKND